MNPPPRVIRRPPRPAERARTPRPPSGPGGAQLRLAIGKDGLGLELAAPAELGPLAVTELVAALPKVKFPVDVSGGVARFRHRRGELVRLSVELSAARLQKLLRERMRGLVGTAVPEVWVGLAPGGATFAIATQAGAAVAFDLVALSTGADLRFVVTDARGIGLPRPAVAVACEAIAALLEGAARRDGSMFVATDVATRIARALLPDHGVRVPSAEGMNVAAFSGAADAWILHLSRGAVPLEASARAAQAAETAWLLRDCDDALVRGDLDAARDLALGLLARAPRHPDAVTRLADVDRLRGDRNEAALAMLGEASGAETPARAVLRAEILGAQGDRGVATHAFAAAGEHDPAPLFAARAFERAAELAEDAQIAATLLDRAVARAPTLSTARHRRLERRLELGRLEDAYADAEELEAQARGPRARYEVWRRAADAFLRAGLREKAGALYERSLRYVPDDPLALAGLGRALVAQGKVGRGVRLLTRAVEAFPAKATRDRDATSLDLARALANALGDKPAAIARLEAIEDRSAVVEEARTLEAELRVDLGDVAGAAFAWARLRNFADSVAGDRDALGDRAPKLASKLVLAARFELDARNDAQAAQRHLRTALRLAPNDGDAQALLRRAGGGVATSVATSTPPLPSESPTGMQAIDFAVEASGDADLEARAEELTRKLQADPTNDAVADELTQLLLKLKRWHEVFALVSARVDEATPERRPVLRAKQRAIVTQLAEEARAAGNEAEAQLFASFANASDDD